MQLPNNLSINFFFGKCFEPVNSPVEQPLRYSLHHFRYISNGTTYKSEIHQMFSYGHSRVKKILLRAISNHFSNVINASSKFIAFYRNQAGIVGGKT